VKSPDWSARQVRETLTAENQAFGDDPRVGEAMQTAVDQGRPSRWSLTDRTVAGQGLAALP